MTSQDMSHATGPDPEYVALYRRLRAEGGVELREQLHARYLDLARGGVTPGGLPYPDPTDPVAEGASAIRALAEALDPIVDWQALIPETGYTVTGAFYAARDGMLRFKGNLTRSAGNFPTTYETVAKLPVGYRPLTYARVPLAGYASPTSNGLVCNVTAAGDIQIAAAGGSAATAYLAAINIPMD